jgi:hypothetical protein
MKTKRWILIFLAATMLLSCSLLQPLHNQPGAGKRSLQPAPSSPRPAAEAGAPATAQITPQDPVEQPVETQTASTISPLKIAKPQIGLNFIRFYWSERRNGLLNTATPYYQPEAIFADFAELGIHTYRQFVRADLMWNIVEPRPGEWNFQAADAVLTAQQPFEPVVTLFALQYASPTPPWVRSPQDFQDKIGSEAETYLQTVVQRYAPVVKYWELGNEMNHWRAADPGEKNKKRGAMADKMPSYAPADGFSPQEQGAFLARAAAIIRQYDPDAVILMPGMGGLDEYTLNTWLPGVIEGGGVDWFDIINYHFYPNWERYGAARQKLTDTIQHLGLSSRPVWLTETGTTASPEVTLRTNYPNSPQAQAADIFRRIVSAYGYGDELVMWHTYISSPPAEDNSWALYGVRTEKGETLLSYTSLKLLVAELIPFESVEMQASDPQRLNIYHVQRKDGQVRYVAWGKGHFTVPEGMSSYTSVVPREDGSFIWIPTQAGKEIPMSEIPVLLK